jgi:hypothetical protein
LSGPFQIDFVVGLVRDSAFSGGKIFPQAATFGWTPNELYVKNTPEQRVCQQCVIKQY